MTRAISIAALFGSVIFAPWFVTLAAGVCLVAFMRSYVPVILAGVAMDAFFGVPVPALGGFAYIYTAFFLVLVLTDLAVRSRMLD
ncbi:MAG: hypothetical protein AAB923_03235 [Patescibacteria group bacterium]